MRSSFSLCLSACAAAVVTTVAVAPAASARPAVDGAARAHGAVRHLTAGSGIHNPLLKQVLAEDDDNNAPDPPAASARCQQYVGRPNPYADPTPNIDMITHDTVVSTGSQAGCYSAQNETTISTNPANPANIVAGTNDYRVYNARESRNDSSGWAYTSMDGGKTWTDVLLPRLTYQTDAAGPLSAMDSAGDPIVVFGPHNTVYYGNIVFSRAAPAAGGTEAPNGIAVNVSHDGGLTWSNPHIVRLDGVDQHGNFLPSHVFNDKVWMAVDQHTGELYVTWTRFNDTPDGGYLDSPIVLSTSTDGGQTFSTERNIDVPLTGSGPGLFPFGSGSNPRVAPDGTLYVAYEGSYCATSACDRPNDHDVTVVARSTDHGRSFTRTVVDRNYDFPAGADGDMVLTGEHFRINSFPQLTIDPVTSLLIVTWDDDRNGQYDPTGASIRTNGDNIVSASVDGVHWSAPVAVGSPQDEVFGAVASYGGVAAVTSYTRRYASSSTKLDYAYWPLTTTGGAVQAQAIQRITTQSSDPRVQFIGVDADGHIVQGTFIGDYTAVSMGSNGQLHPAWTDFRGNPGVTTPNQDAYTQSVNLGD